MLIKRWVVDELEPLVLLTPSTNGRTALLNEDFTFCTYAKSIGASSLRPTSSSDISSLQRAPAVPERAVGALTEFSTPMEQFRHMLLPVEYVMAGKMLVSVSRTSSPGTRGAAARRAEQPRPDDHGVRSLRRARTILFLRKDRWLCTKCRMEGVAPPNSTPSRRPTVAEIFPNEGLDLIYGGFCATGPANTWLGLFTSWTASTVAGSAATAASWAEVSSAGAYLRQTISSASWGTVGTTQSGRVAQLRR